VSLSPTATEMLFAMGAGGQVVAVDDQSNYPPEAPHSNLSGFQPNVEAIAADNPDLVVVSNDTNGIVASLKTLKIPVLVEPAATTLDDSYHQIAELGDATGNGGGAATEITSMKDKISSIVSSIPKRSTPLRYYHELDNTYYSVTSKTFIGAIYTLVGLVNIADAADKQGSGYPQLSAEYIVNANPDFVFLADTKCCQQNAASVAARPGWSTLSAVRNGRVVALDDDIASRWGPRTPDLLAAVAAVLEKVP
jgi:iron complex transport system substrate-binding protein